MQNRSLGLEVWPAKKGLAEAEPRLVTIFLTVSALVNIGLGYWLATYLARERARAAMQGDYFLEGTVDSSAGHGDSLHATVHSETPPGSAAIPIEPQPIVGVATTIPPTLPALETTAAPATSAPELETEVLAGIEEFRNQLAQMKATPAAADHVSAPA